MLDLAIINGKIIDGTGSPRYRADLGVKAGRIVAIGREVGEAEQVIDARDQVVAPGFIDIHTHSDAALVADPRGQSAVQQGVTTHVIGNCGYTVFPIVEAARRVLGRFGLEPTWTDLRGYASRLQEQGLGLNVMPLLGHGTIRAAVMGDADRPPNPPELAKMKQLVADGMAAGAVGMSSGLIYPPGSFARLSELVELSRVVAEYDGLYTSHIRGEGKGLVAAVQEAIKVGEQAGLPVQVSHHKAVGRDSWGLVNETLPLMDQARRRGVNVTWDQYPYLATSTRLSVFVPKWAHDGGNAGLLARLSDAAERRRILDELEQMNRNWADVMISFAPKNRAWQGQRLTEIAESLQLSAAETLLYILAAEETNADMVYFGMSEADVITVMRHPITMIASDGLAVATDGPTCAVRQHPRSYGTFPRVLGRYVREKGVLTLEEAIRKMTSAPAQRLGLPDRGRLQAGLWADITIFDPEQVTDRATFTDPHQYPEGIGWVLVNGEVVVERQQHRGRLPGRVLLKS